MSLKEIRVTMSPSKKRIPRIPPRLGDEEADIPQTPPAPRRAWSSILVYVALAWLTVITFLVAMRLLAAPPPPVFAEKKDRSKWIVPFNVVPDGGDNPRIMTLKVSTMNFSQVLRYDVCCRKGGFYVCRAVSKNLGMDCYLTSDNKAILFINHPDMVGAQCNLLWSETLRGGGLF